MTEPLLDLDTLIERPTVDIDGERYEMRAPDELSVIDNRRTWRWGQELDTLQKDDVRPKDEVDQAIAAKIDQIARFALVGVPDDVFAKLSGQNKIKVVEVFTALRMRTQAGVAGATARAMGNQQIGDLFSQAFSGSTAARPVSGWRKRLSAWFGRI